MSLRKRNRSKARDRRKLHQNTLILLGWEPCRAGYRVGITNREAIVACDGRVAYDVAAVNYPDGNYTPCKWSALHPYAFYLVMTHVQKRFGVEVHA